MRKLICALKGHEIYTRRSHGHTYAGCYRCGWTLHIPPGGAAWF